MYNFDEVRDRVAEGSSKWKSEYPGVIGMANADMDFRAADNIRARLEKVAENGVFGYYERPQEYFDSIINWYKRRYDWDIKKEWISNCFGIWACTRICMGVFTKPGDCVLIQSPFFWPIPRIIKDAGCEVLENTLKYQNGRFEIDFDDFERKVRERKPSVFFLVNPQNPTGRAFTKEELDRMVHICTENNVLVISDEVHGNHTFDGHKHIPVSSISEEALQNTIIITGPSKGYNLMSLTYCIVLVPNDELREKWEFAMKVYNWYFGVNIFGLTGVTEAFSERTDSWLAACNAYLQENLDELCAFFKERIPKLKVIKPEASYMAWIDCSALNMSGAELADFFERQCKVKLSPGEGFGPDGKGYMRINFACPRSVLNEALLRMENGVNSL